MGLAPKTHQQVGVVREIRGQNLDRNLSIEVPIVSPVHVPHSARPHRRKNLVRAQHGARFQRTAFDGRLLQKRDVPHFVRGNERFNFVPQRLFRASLVEICTAVSGLSFKRPGEYFLHPLPDFRRHLRASFCFISRWSQARAVAHSRFTEAGEMPRTTAVSSMESPPKKRSSINRLCCGSRVSSLVKASSSATRFTSRLCGRAICGSRANRGTPAPRLAAKRPRAWSTRMCRISCAAKPKKCARFCHWGSSS